VSAPLALSSAWAQDDQAEAKDVEKAEKKMADASKLPTATMETSMGAIVLALFPDSAPKAVENFVGLSKKGYYEGVIFHRIIKDFMIQGGDPTGTGMGGKSVWELPFEDEFDKNLRFDGPGILAMANAGPKTNGSQFFITLAKTPWLNDRHTIFGEVIEGMDIVEAMGAVETGLRDKPVKDIAIQKITIHEPGERDAE
jgi:peptidylprolyl isomerase